MKMKTIRDLAAEMRTLADDIEAGRAIVGQTVWRNYADRFEAAAEREREEAEAAGLAAGGMVEAARHAPPNPGGAAPSAPVGNAAAMREALEYLVEQRDILDFCHNNLGSKTWEDWDKVYKVLRKIIEKAMRALSALPRNCDMRKETRSET